MRWISAATLVAAMLFSGAGAQASKAAPPRSSHNAVSAWHAYCAGQPASWSQQVLCGIRSHDKAIAISGALLVVAALGWISIDAARRLRGGR
jgi:hypothetical protein